nr:MAG TPA: hypothetical protein [Caudoviricetes sp.]
MSNLDKFYPKRKAPHKAGLNLIYSYLRPCVHAQRPFLPRPLPFPQPLRHNRPPRPQYRKREFSLWPCSLRRIPLHEHTPFRHREIHQRETRIRTGQSAERREYRAIPE